MRLETSLLTLLLILTLGLAPACSDDAEPDKGPPAGDLYAPPDGAQADAPPDTSPAACTEGDKRCDGLDKIEHCQGGAWVPLEDCSQKKIGSQSCKCSITLMFVCAVGPNACT